MPVSNLRSRLLLLTLVAFLPVPRPLAEGRGVWALARFVNLAPEDYRRLRLEATVGRLPLRVS